MKNNNVNGIESVKASLGMEGLKLSKEQEQLIIDSVEGKISEEEFNKRARELANG
ncbi:antitoxin VbhA family protein (plasmid) [Niallia taxi]|uniref:antitoxin VbhA family protein n=1 Tax=Niallia TaxID=2837506 RepID=UPI0015F436B8|nr:antitoxin VbhA family protein [Niallia taxi]MED4057216.1 antitoxin VbhA family protein [Niallia taxi]MED4122187.1 antitoxin VbhA family protein [Niallia taxi]